ncbi:MAG: hypothetical protein ACRDOL_28650 [Streptosporangiaceae bacterium]
MARIGLDGSPIEGELPPIQAAVVATHTAIYQDHLQVGRRAHPFPYATAYAVAHRPIYC